MIKFLFILLIAFNIYLFMAIDISAKAEIVKATAAIPGKFEQLITSAGESLNNRLAMEQGR